MWQAFDWPKECVDRITKAKTNRAEPSHTEPNRAELSLIKPEALDAPDQVVTEGQQRV